MKQSPGNTVLGLQADQTYLLASDTSKVEKIDVCLKDFKDFIISFRTPSM